MVHGSVKIRGGNVDVPAVENRVAGVKVRHAAMTAVLAAMVGAPLAVPVHLPRALQAILRLPNLCFRILPVSHRRNVPVSMTVVILSIPTDPAS